MNIFLDSAHIPALKKWIPTGLIDGVTTNPSLLSKEGKDPKQHILEICSLLPQGQISVEITEKEPEQVYAQAKKIASLAKNVVVKIPCYLEYYPVIKRLVDEGVKLNITLVFTLIQAFAMSKLGVTMISPFVGRWDDIDVEGAQILYAIREMIDNYGYETKILAASIRSPRHVHEALLAGADIITLPPDILATSLDHVLTNQGIAKFDADWQKLGVKQFP